MNDSYKGTNNNALGYGHVKVSDIKIHFRQSIEE